MRKRKIIGMLVSAMVVLYCICLCISFGISTNYVNSEYENEMQKMDQYFKMGFVNSAWERSPQEIAGTMSKDWDSPYPWKLYILDENGDVIEESGNWINFETIFGEYARINLDDYLEDETRQELIDFQESTRSGRILVYGVDYGYEDRKVVPVALYVKDELDYFNHKKIVVTEFNKWSGVRADNIELEGLKIDSDFKALNLEYQYVNCYAEFDLSVQRGETKSYIRKRFRDDNFNLEDILGVTLDGMRQSYFRLGTDQGVYMGYIVSTHNSFREAWKSSVFHTAVLMQTLLFGIVGAVLLIAANYICEKNRRLEEARQSFTSAAAHELKTPLSVIQNQCECILEQIAPDKQMEYVFSIYEESLRMNKLVRSFLQYNRLASIEKIEMEEVPFTELVNREVEQYQPLLEEKNISLNKNLQKEIKVKCNRELMARAIDNFLMNAVKYCPEEGVVSVQLQSVGGKRQFSVTNTCGEIQEADLKKMWDILYQMDKSRNSENNSTGMGLPITKQILERHHMKYGCEKVNGGVKFWFEM